MNSAKQINQLRRLERVPVWQRNYYEHIIRNDQSSTNIRNYIINNPWNWEHDEENLYRRIIFLNVREYRLNKGKS